MYRVFRGSVKPFFTTIMLVKIDKILFGPKTDKELAVRWHSYICSINLVVYSADFLR